MNPEDMISKVNYRFPICPYCEELDTSIDVRPNSQSTVYCNYCDRPYELWARVECTTYGNFQEMKPKRKSRVL